MLITQQNSCPVSRNTAAAVKALQDEYTSKGVEIFMLNSTPSDKRDDIVVEAAAYGYNLPILMDSNQLVGEQLGVTRTAEVIVIDPKTWKIVYRGPIDDRVTYERQKAKADHTWAKDALDAQLAGKPVAVAQVQSVGCLIDFPERAKLASSKVNYVKNIAPMFEDKCVSCHQKGGIGPMSLTSYVEIKPFSPMIREMIRTQAHAALACGSDRRSLPRRPKLVVRSDQDPGSLGRSGSAARHGRRSSGGQELHRSGVAAG